MPVSCLPHLQKYRHEAGVSAVDKWGGSACEVIQPYATSGERSAATSVHENSILVNHRQFSASSVTLDLPHCKFRCILCPIVQVWPQGKARTRRRLPGMPK